MPSPTDDPDSIEARVMRLHRRHVHAKRAPGEVPAAATLTPEGEFGRDAVVSVKLGPHAGSVGILMPWGDGSARVVSADTIELVTIKLDWARAATLEERQAFAKAESEGAERGMEARRADAKVCGCETDDEVTAYAEGCMEPVVMSPMPRPHEVLEQFTVKCAVYESALEKLRSLHRSIGEQVEALEQDLYSATVMRDGTRDAMAAAGILLRDPDAPPFKYPWEGD